MTSFEIIKEDVAQVQDSLCQRSDVYNGKRVMIRAQKWLGTLLVCIKDLPPREFNIDADPLQVANYIQEHTANKQDIAHKICNTVGCSDNYPLVYQAAYEILYKGRLTKKTAKSIEYLQTADVRKLGYVPETLFAQLKSITE